MGDSQQTSVHIPASQTAVTHPSTLKPAHVPQLLSFLCAIVALALLQLACSSHALGPQTPVSANQSTFSHVVLVVEENHNYSEVIGNSAMPYLNSLASQYGLATQYFANGHPSMPNYLMLTTGQMESFDDNFSGIISDDNIVRELVNAGKSWKAYEESIPSPGYLGGDVAPYVRRHNPFSYLSDVQNDPSQAANIVPFSQFASDLSSNTLPQYSFIAPDVNDDAHDGTLAAADAWLDSNIAPLLASSTFQSSGLLIITFDESEDTDVEHGGGHVATVIISSKSKMKYQSQAEYQHQSTLRLVLAASGVDKFPGLAGTAPDMTEFFTGQ
jgi:phosphatidylinositol-3-phosphatase